LLDWGLCQSKIGDADPTISAEEYVLGLEIPVENAGHVRGSESSTRVDKYTDDVSPTQLLPSEPIRERAPFDKFHRNENLISNRPDIVDRKHVRVRQLRHDLRLAQQARATSLRVFSLRWWAHQLNGDPAVQLGIEGCVDKSHSPAAQLSLQYIATDNIVRRRSRSRVPWSSMSEIILNQIGDQLRSGLREKIASPFIRREKRFHLSA
jgi:hypothetical protein